MKLKGFKGFILFFASLATFSTVSSELSNIGKLVSNDIIDIGQKSNHNQSSDVKLTFDPNGGSLTGYKTVATKSDVEFKNVTGVPSVSREGAKSNPGWYYKNGEQKIVVEDTTTFKVDTTLFANWTFYNVTFNAGEGSFANGEKEKKFSNVTCVHSDELTNPTCKNMIFDGWKLNSETIKFPYYPSGDNENITLTATYKNAETVMIAFMALDGYFSTTTDKVRYLQVPRGETWGIVQYKYSIPEPSITGELAFSSWLLNNSDISNDFIFGAPVLLTASYQTAIQVTFDANGGKYSDSSVKKISSKIFVKDGNEPTFSKFIDSALEYDSPTITVGSETYELLGWFFTKGADGDQILPTDKVFKKTNFTVYATYKIPHYIKLEGSTEFYSIAEDIKNPYYRKDTLHYTIVPKNGYTFAVGNVTISWDGKERTLGKDYTLTINDDHKGILTIKDAPAFDITIDVSTTLRSYEISPVSPLPKGVSSIKLDDAESSKKVKYTSNVKVSATPLAGYEIREIQFYNGSSLVDTVQGSETNYTMPAYDIIVKPVAYALSYDITLGSKDAGVSDIQFKSKACTDESVTATATAVTGHKISKMIVKDTAGNVYKDASGGSITFTMPAYPVTISAVSAVFTYTIRWLNDDGSLLKSEEYEYGSLPSYSGTPTKKSTEEFDYEFAGWNPSISTVTGNQDYKATYNSIKRKYEITFENYNHSVLEVYTLEYGATPVYSGETPTRESTKEFSYVWTGGWDKEIKAVTGPETYTATFKSKINEYEIKFVSEDGSKVYETKKVPYGAIPEYTGSETPSKDPTVSIEYKFDGWSPDISKVVDNTTYKAKFKEEVRKYTIRFLNDDGEVLQSSQVEYGATPVYEGPTPTKPTTERYYYYFVGWDYDITEVTGDKDYTAIFNEFHVKYTVYFNNNGGHIKYEDVELTSIELPCDSSIIEELEWIEITATHDYAKFKGWSMDSGKTILDNETLMPTHDITLTPVWDTYNIVVTGEHCTTKVKSLSNVIQVYSDDIGVSVESGYKFSGFMYSIDSGATYKSISSMPFKPYLIEPTLNDGDTIYIKAVCEPITETVDIFLDGNGGSFDSEGTITSQTYSVIKGKTWGEVKNSLPQIVKAPAGKTFDKWVDQDDQEILDDFIIDDVLLIKACYK